MKADKKNWLRLLAYVTGSINQELLLRNEYLAGRESHFEIADQRTIAVVRWREGNLGGDSRCRKFRAHGRLSICYGGKRCIDKVIQVSNVIRGEGLRSAYHHPGGRLG